MSPLPSACTQHFSNGTAVNVTVHDLLGTLANHWRDMNVSGFLADYGGAPNLLE
jgi:hypothetical protein